MKTTEKNILPRERLVSLDIIRGIAVLGILMVNIAGFALPFAALSNPTIAGVDSCADYYAWYFTDLLITNNMRGLFSMLFGASIILLTQKIEQQQNAQAARSYFFRRNSFLLLFGLIHSYILLMAGDVLFPYAVAGFGLYFLRNLKAPALITIAIMIIVLQTALSHLGYHELATIRDAAGAKAEQWQAIIAELGTSQAEISEEINAMKGGYLNNLITIAPFVLFLQTYYLLTEFVWDVGSMMLLGMAFYKTGIIQGAKSRMFYVLLAITGLTVGIMINFTNLLYLESQNFDLLSEQKTQNTLRLGRVALTLGILGLLNLFIAAPAAHWFKDGLAAVGRMALSNYLMQTVICIFIFYGFGFNLYNELGRASLLLVMVMIWTFQFFFSIIWLQYFQYGPVEWLWRSLTLRKKIPLKIR
ncbi:MAG: DUF418 domain-containing protein [Emcibacter sp.]|nr:DUF418 domain-containing protein [Emcibacter sp.]